jgi:putative ABC transport system permease protein
MMVYWKFAWREIRQRPSRPLLTLLSIIIGVGAVVAVSITSGTSRRAFDAIYKTVAGRASLQLSAPVGTSFDAKVVEKVRSVPGVEAVAPLIQRYVMLYIGKKKHYRVVALGVDPAEDQKVRDYEIVAGKSLADAPGVILEKTFARNIGREVRRDLIEVCPPMLANTEQIGLIVAFDYAIAIAMHEMESTVELQVRRGRFLTPVVGLFTSTGTAATGQGASLMMSLDSAQSLFKARGKIDSAQIVVRSDADEAKVREEIAAILPTGVTVERPPTHSSLAEETSLSTDQGMRMSRAFSLLVAVFIITNTFLINVTQRRRQLGIMRAIGATRPQVAGMMYREAFMMGIVGTAIGSVLGVIAAHFLTIAMGTLYETTLPAIQLSATPFLIGIGCGLGISMLAAALPARKASHLSPLEAMRDVLPEEIEGASKWLVVTGIIIIVTCLALLIGSITGFLPMLIAVWAAILLLVGVVLTLPIALRPLSSFAAFALRPILAVEGRLARLQLLRHHSRTTLTVGVVFIAISTGIGLANSIMDNVANVEHWYKKAIVADYFVRATAPDMATGLAADLPDNIGPEIQKIPGIKSMDAQRFVKVKVNGLDESALIVARDHSAPGVPDFDIVKGDPDHLRDQLMNGEVALGSVLAERAKYKVGDELTLETEQGPKKFRIAAIVNDYLAGGLTVHIERNVARRELGIDGIDAYLIKADHERLPEVRKALEAIAAENGLMVQSNSEIQQKIDGMMAGVVASLWAMGALGLLVSAVGVTNTLTINVLEQTREIGLLRIVAMTRAQVRKTVFTQAMIVAILALVPGILAGVAVAYLINAAMQPVIGHSVTFTLHPWLLGGGLVAGMAVVSLAAWFPSDRAARLDLPTALRMA